MKHDRLEHELSQFVDGRLPSGRREQLLDLLDADGPAAGLLDEMEAAQALARSLPSQHVTGGFSETLWQRIRSGEGTPEAVFREPLSPWVKARYVASGAAAAAAALVAVSLLATPEPLPAPEPVPELARADAALATEPALGRLRPAVADSAYRPSLNFTSIVPQTVAEAGQLACVDALASLQSRAAHVERRLGQSEPAELYVELEPEVGRVRGATGLMRSLQQREIVEYPAGFETTLALTERVIARMRDARDRNDALELRVALRDLRDLQVDHLRQQFTLRCCDTTRDFPAMLRDLILRDPLIACSLDIVPIAFGDSATGVQIPPSMPPFPTFQFGADPIGNGVLLIRTQSFHAGYRSVSSGESFEVRVQVRDDGRSPEHRR